jgi:uncharacterized protein (TIGR01244 family)
MKDPIKISDRVSAGGQPDTTDLKRLAEAGFKSVINLRADGEANQPLSPRTEQTEAAAAGLGYRHVPVAVDNLSDTQVEAFRAAIAELPGPVYVHCGAGQRACAFSLLSERAGSSAESVFQEAEAKGIAFPDKPIRDLIGATLKHKPEG